MKEIANRNTKRDVQSFKSLCEALALQKTPESMMAFLNDLCTPAEIQAMADRWLVVKPISEGVPYREIHDKTGVSVTTIGRVARMLSYGSGGYRVALKQMERKNVKAKT